MSCDIQYLRDKHSGQELQALSNFHYNIKDELDNSGYFRKIDGNLTFFKNKLVPEAIAKIGSINSRYRNYLPESSKLVWSENGAVRINISPVEGHVLAVLDATRKRDQEKAYQDENNLEEIFYYEGTKQGETEPVAPNSEAAMKESNKLFQDIIDRIQENITANKVVYSQKSYARNYVKWLNSLKQIIENKDELKAIQGYITYTSQQLTYARRELDKLKDKYKNVSELSLEQVTDFSERLSEIKDFMHFYKPLEEIQSILKANDIVLQDNYKEGFKEKIGSALTEDIRKAIDQLKIGNPTSERRLIDSITDPTLKKEITKALDIAQDTISENKLSEALDNQGAIIRDFKEYFTNLTAEWLYPYIEQANKKAEGRIDKDKITSKEDLKSILRVANFDLNVFSRYFGATITSSDPVVAATAVALKSTIYEAQDKTNAAVYDLSDAFFSLNVKPDQIEDYHQKYMRKASVYTGKLDDNNKPIYTQHDAFHEEFFYDTYDRNYREMMDDLKARINAERTRQLNALNQQIKAGNVLEENIPKSKELIEKSLIRLKAQIMGAWFKKNSSVINNIDDLIEKKRSTLTPKSFQNWLKSNIIIYEEKSYYDEYGDVKLASDYAVEDGRTLLEASIGEEIGLKQDQYAVLIGDFIRPNDSYRNDKFTELMQDNYYKILYKAYKDANDLLPYTGRNKFGIIPQVPKDKTLLESYKGINKDNVKDKIKDGLKKQWTADVDEYPIDIPNEDGTYETIMATRVQQKADGTIIKNIPVRYTSLIQDTENVSKNLFETVNMFVHTSNQYNAMARVEPNIQILKTLIRGDSALDIDSRAVKDTNAKGNPKLLAWFVKGVPKSLLKEKDVRVNELLLEFIDDVVYGEEEEQSVTRIFGQDISWNKVGNKLGLLTSLYSMAGNITAGINNTLLGNINTFSESIGGRYYTPKDWASAKKEYWNEVRKGTFFKDLVENNRAKKSLFTQLQIKFDALQGEFLDPRGNVTTGSTANKLISRDTLFFNQHVTEHEIQMTSLIALLKGYKLSDGSSLFDAYRLDAGGRLVIIDGKKNVVTPQVEESFRNLLHGINKQHHGNYNKFDKASAQRKWYGKAALMFRKYIYTSAKARWGSKQIDYEMQDVVQGYYSVSSDIAFNYLKKLVGDIAGYQDWSFQKIYANGDTMSEDEKYAIKRTAAELSMLAATTAIVMIMGSLDFDDDDDFAYGVQLQAKRVQQDIIAFIPPLGFSSVIRIFTNPAAAFNVIEKIQAFLVTLITDPFGTYDRKVGYAEKGDSKLWIRLQKLLPLYRQYINFTTPSEQIKFYNLLNTSSK